MIRINEIKCTPIAGFNVLVLIGVDVLLIKQDIGVDTIFTAYIGNVYYGEQKVAKTAFMAMVKEFKQVANQVAIEERWNPTKENERVCVVMSRPMVEERITVEKLLSASHALALIEQPFSNDGEEKGNIKDMIELWE